MGTKNNPGKFDCYANAEPDEPMFVLLARDERAPALVELWAAVRANDRRAFNAAVRSLELAAWTPSDRKKVKEEKVVEARACAMQMRHWKRKKRDEQ